MDNSIPILYHYCSVESFFHIITTKTLRLYDLSHTNDSLELKWGRDKIFSMFKTIFNKDISNNGRFLYQINNQGAYAICFSEEGDLLSQWRGYADDGRGVAIGFDIEKLGIQREPPGNSVIKNHTLGYEKVIYDEKEQEKILQPLFIAIKKFGSTDEQIEAIISGLGRYAIFFKNPAFKEEKEWRLVYRDTGYLFTDDSGKLPHHLGSLHFQIKEDVINNYYEFSFEEYLPQNPIKTIFFGPKCKLKTDYLLYFLHKSGIKIFNNDQYVIQINKSKASYR